MTRTEGGGPAARGALGWAPARASAPRLLGALLLLALLGLAAAQGGQSGQNNCPAAADIQPCGCTVKKNGLDILCEATETQHINKAMDALKRRGNAVIFYLKLRHNALPKLLQFVFLGLDIRHLTIHNSSLAVVEESSLSSVGKKLTQLDLSQNILTMVPSKALSTLHHLLILNLNHNKISAIHNNAFLGLDTLEILTLYENKIDVVDVNAFEGLGKKLKRLNLGGNGLRQVPQKALATLEVLRKLEMQENELTEIREGDFEGLRNLDTLNLQHNRLNTVPAKVFSHLKLLNSLELENNQIRFVDPDAFSGLEENLQYLRLGDNKLNEIPSDALRRLHRLRHLDLRVNNITFIPDDAFSGFGDSITFLNLQKNAKFSLKYTCNSYVWARAHLPKISLKLLAVLLYVCEREAVKIDLKASAVRKATGDSVSLSLGPRPPTQSCGGLSCCSILVLPGLAFENLNSLETLNLQNNKLEHVSEEVMEPIIDTVTHFDLSDNPLICTCDLAWYHTWYRKAVGMVDEPAAHKRKTMCYLNSEHREYNLLALPLEKMQCVGKNLGQISAASHIFANFVLSSVILSGAALLLI
ncbi:Protein artichoke [Frankliniella fusca]|uniref:Protein artichoke n=1 Tax=Frankliniella fusca TaxID=407009 RepID=A0AAE1I1V1_9NEOP|nr:Protein artichoke [Frankliniella fusca]